MRISLPTIWEDKTSRSADIPARMQSYLLPNAEKVCMRGPWGSLLEQSVKRQDYTIYLYHGYISETSIDFYATSSADRFALFVLEAGKLGDSIVLDTFQSCLVHQPGGRSSRWELQKGLTVLLLAELEESYITAFTTAPLKPVYLTREAHRLLQGLQENLSNQVAPGLYLDGVVAALLQEHMQQLQASKNASLLDNPPFPFHQKDMDAVEKAKAILDGSIKKRVSVKELASSTRTNQDILQKGFKYAYGQTIHQYWLSTSLRHAQQLLRTTMHPIKAVGLACGFDNYPYFIQQFKKQCGMTPGLFRKST